MNDHTEYDTDAAPIAITEYHPVTAALALLREKYAAPFTVTTTAGLAAAKAARAEIRGLRTALEKTRADLKAPLLAQGRWIDLEAQRITAELLTIEEPIDGLIKAEERRKADEKAARERAEAARLAALQAQIDAIRQRVLAVANQDAAAIRRALTEAQAFEPDPDEFAEQWPAAMRAIVEVRQALTALLSQQEAREAQQTEEKARLQAQRDALSRQRAELDRQRQRDEEQRRVEREELARLRAQETARQEAEARAERERQEAEARAERERQEAEAQARAETEARSQAERTATTTWAKKPAQIDPLAAIKSALAEGALTGVEAIDRAYQLGFEAGACAQRQAA